VLNCDASNLTGSANMSLNGRQMRNCSLQGTNATCAAPDLTQPGVYELRMPAGSLACGGVQNHDIVWNVTVLTNSSVNVATSQSLVRLPRAVHAATVSVNECAGSGRRGDLCAVVRAQL
jgi:hypothetical protein